MQNSRIRAKYYCIAQNYISAQKEIKHRHIAPIVNRALVEHEGSGCEKIFINKNMGMSR